MFPFWILENFMEGTLVLSIFVSFAVAYFGGRLKLKRVPLLALVFFSTYVFVVAAVQLFDVYIGRTFESLEAAGVQGPEMIRLADLYYLDTGRSLILFTAIIYATLNTMVVMAGTWMGAKLRKT